MAILRFLGIVGFSAARIQIDFVHNVKIMTWGVGVKNVEREDAMATISQYIRKDLGERISQGDLASIRLSLPGLSEHYGVSASPVREAIRKLVADGLLVRRPNGRLEISPDRLIARAAVEAPGPIDVDRRLVDRANELEKTLEAEVIRMSVRGDGRYLREETTARRLGVGRTAIRQAFHRLAGRGLIVHVPRCGWKVRTFDESDLTAYLEIREVLELKALALARPHLVDADLRRMVRDNSGKPDAPRLDNALHGYLVEKSGNGYLRDFFNRHGSYHAALLDFAAPETDVVASMARHHRLILRALLARDWPRARRELSRHIRSQRSIVRRLRGRLGQNGRINEDAIDSR
jgi:DNA-binding GntR family transcriptional regulator